MSCLTCALLGGLMLENSAGRACALYLSVSQMAACYCSRRRSGQIELLLDRTPVLKARDVFFHKSRLQSLLVRLHQAIDNPSPRQKKKNASRRDGAQRDVLRFTDTCDKRIQLHTTSEKSFCFTAQVALELSRRKRSNSGVHNVKHAKKNVPPV